MKNKEKDLRICKRKILGRKRNLYQGKREERKKLPFILNRKMKEKTKERKKLGKKEQGQTGQR